MSSGMWEKDSDVLRAAVDVPEHVVHRAFVDQSVALNLQTSQYYGLNMTAARMLEALSRVELVKDAVAPLADELAEEAVVIERSLVTLCRDLTARGLIELRHVEAD